MTCVFIRRENRDAETHRKAYHVKMEQRLERWPLQGTPGVADNHQKLGRSKEGFFPRTPRASMTLSNTFGLYFWPPEL